MVTHSEHDAKFSHRIIRMLDVQTVTENILVLISFQLPTEYVLYLFQNRYS